MSVPQFTRGDRMRIALRHAGVGVQEMADYLGVGRNTVSTWINDRITPSRQTVMLWAMRCGVPVICGIHTSVRRHIFCIRIS